MLRITNGLVVDGGEILKKDVYINDGKIFAVTDAALPADETVDAGGKYVSAGFIDTHVHGGGGADFMDGGIEPMRVAGMAAERTRMGKYPCACWTACPASWAATPMAAALTDP